MEEMIDIIVLMILSTASIGFIALVFAMLLTLAESGRSSLDDEEQTSQCKN